MNKRELLIDCNWGHLFEPGRFLVDSLVACAYLPIILHPPGRVPDGEPLIEANVVNHRI